MSEHAESTTYEAYRVRSIVPGTDEEVSTYFDNSHEAWEFMRHLDNRGVKVGFPSWEKVAR